jgi:hypothetical protein
MTSITVFIIAFGVGCLTGVIVKRFQRASDEPRAPLFWPLLADD